MKDQSTDEYVKDKSTEEVEDKQQDASIEELTHDLKDATNEMRQVRDLVLDTVGKVGIFTKRTAVSCFLGAVGTIFGIVIIPAVETHVYENRPLPKEYEQAIILASALAGAAAGAWAVKESFEERMGRIREDISRLGNDPQSEQLRQTLQEEYEFLSKANRLKIAGFPIQTQQEYLLSPGNQPEVSLNAIKTEDLQLLLKELDSQAEEPRSLEESKEGDKRPELTDDSSLT